jgi:hypothetical protein
MTRERGTFIIDLKQRRYTMHINIALQPLLALVAGIVILAVPKLLNYIVAGYLILVGLAGILRF